MVVVAAWASGFWSALGWCGGSWFQIVAVRVLLVFYLSRLDPLYLGFLPFRYLSFIVWVHPTLSGLLGL